MKLDLAMCPGTAGIWAVEIGGRSVDGTMRLPRARESTPPKPHPIATAIPFPFAGRTPDRYP
jgi:hypothetical protein